MVAVKRGGEGGWVLGCKQNWGGSHLAQHNTSTITLKKQKIRKTILGSFLRSWCSWWGQWGLQVVPACSPGLEESRTGWVSLEPWKKWEWRSRSRSSRSTLFFFLIRQQHLYYTFKGWIMYNFSIFPYSPSKYRDNSIFFDLWQYPIYQPQLQYTLCNCRPLLIIQWAAGRLGERYLPSYVTYV